MPYVSLFPSNVFLQKNHFPIEHDHRIFDSNQKKIKIGKS